VSITATARPASVRLTEEKSLTCPGPLSDRVHPTATTTVNATAVRFTFASEV
jgi:hypothetical protein